jgi:hypothetical protein
MCLNGARMLRAPTHKGHYLGFGPQFSARMNSAFHTTAVDAASE